MFIFINIVKYLFQVLKLKQLRYLTTSDSQLNIAMSTMV